MIDPFDRDQIIKRGPLTPFGHAERVRRLAARWWLLWAVAHDHQISCQCHRCADARKVIGGAT